MWLAQTPGEQVYALARRVLDNPSNSAPRVLDDWLSWTGRNQHLREFFVELAAIHTVRRLVEHVRPVAEEYDEDDPLFATGTRAAVADVLALNDPRVLRRIEDLAGRSAIAARTEISPGTRKQMEREIRTTGQTCYMCGTGFDFTGVTGHLKLTLDHIWPRAYGGDSQPGNLLGACESCNSKKKTDFAVWALPGVQALNLGMDPSGDMLDDIHGSFKYALHRRSVMSLAIEHGLTLQEAYVRAGPWSEFSVMTAHEAADFFNIGLVE